MVRAECSTEGRVKGYDKTVAGNKLDTAIGICISDGSEVDRGIPLKVTLLGGTCEVDTVLIVGALGYGSTTFVEVGCVIMEDVVIIGSGTSEVTTCGDRRSSSFISDNQEGLYSLVVACVIKGIPFHHLN